MREQSENVQLTERALDALPSEEARVIRMRFGLPPFSREYTPEEVAQHCSMHVKAVQELQQSGLRRLRS